MSFLDLAKRRYSVRSYAQRKVEKEKLEYIIEAGRVAPTAVYEHFRRRCAARNDASAAASGRDSDHMPAP